MNIEALLAHAPIRLILKLNSELFFPPIPLLRPYNIALSRWGPVE